MITFEAVKAVDRLHAVRDTLAVIEAALSSRPADWHPCAAGGLSRLVEKAMNELTDIAEDIHPTQQPKSPGGKDD